MPEFQEYSVMLKSSLFKKANKIKDVFKNMNLIIAEPERKYATNVNFTKL